MALHQIALLVVHAISLPPGRFGVGDSIMLSASDVEPEAWRAGVDAFLRKPDDVVRLSEMVTRLLSGKK